MKQIIPANYSYLGIFLIAFGVVVNVWSDNLFKKTKTTVKPYEKPTFLITSGPFLFSRHPMYLGMASILLGSAVMLQSLITFIFPFIFIIIMEVLFIPKEEKSLEKVFGKKYLDYKKRVRRWI